MQPLGVFMYICQMNNDSEIIDYDNCIAPWLGKTIKIIDYHLQELLIENNTNLTKEQMIVLKKLHENDGLNQNELAFLTLRNKSSLTRLLVKMETKGYIIRKQCESDKRINKVYLTNSGKEKFQKTRPVIKKMIDIVEQDITNSEKEMIIKILQKIQANFNTKI